MNIPWWRSVRVRIAVTVTVVSLLVSGIVGFVLAERAASAATDAVRADALGRLAVASDGYALDGRLRFGASLDPSAAPAGLQAAVANSAVNKQATYYDGERMWAAGRLGPHVVLVIALDASTLRAQNTERMWALGWAAGAAGLGSIALGWLAGFTLSRRLRRAASAATQIAEGASGVRASQGGHDEVTQLTRAVDEMADALRRRLDAEKAFTSDVAHELRTPLTGLVSASELLDDGPATDLVRQQVARLRRLVEDLLEVSRLDRAADPAQLVAMPLDVAVRESLQRQAPLLDTVTIDVQLAASDLVLVEPRRLDRIVANLLINLARHGGGVGTVQVSGHCLTVLDQGAGYPAELIEFGPRPFHATGAGKGSGLGLTIVAKQAETMGAEVRFGANPHGPGALTRVYFQPASPDESQSGKG